VESSFEASTTFLRSRRYKPTEALRSISITGLVTGELGFYFKSALPPPPPLLVQLGGQFIYLQWIYPTPATDTHLEDETCEQTSLRR
jgi:hypothetical protein